jgi:hexosaminidase
MDMITAMSYNKMNVLHWHIVDGNSFPYQSEFYPELSLYGAYHPNLVYTSSQIKNLISFANDHGVRVLPEFDMPSHATSWGYFYDFMILNCFPRSPDPYDYSGIWSGNPMDPTNPQVYSLVENFLAEVTTVFVDNWFHLGGDEVFYQCWNTSAINQYMAQNGIKTYQELEAIFISKVNSHIKENFPRNLIYWQEVFQSTSPFIGNAVDVWKDAATISNVIKQNIYAIQSFGWYLNELQQQWTDYYAEDPVPPNTPINLQQYVIGGEASIWGEGADATNIFQRVWPRACAVAERLWSPASMKNANQAVPRLAIHRCRLVNRGIPAEPFQPDPGCYL